MSCWHGSGPPVRAITGTQAAPAFFELFTCILDRLDALDGGGGPDVNDEPEYDEEWEDCAPSTDNDDPDAGPIT